MQRRTHSTHFVRYTPTLDSTQLEYSSYQLKSNSILGLEQNFQKTDTKPTVIVQVVLTSYLFFIQLQA